MKLYQALLFALILSGCQPYAVKPVPEELGPAVYYPEVVDSCDFESIQSRKFVLAQRFKPYVTNSFYYDPTKEAVWQLDKANYQSLVHNKFKILKTGVITEQDTKRRLPSLAAYRYEEMVIDGIPFKRDKGFSTKVITEDCRVFYLNGDTTSKSLSSSLTLENGESLESGELLLLYGLAPLESVNFDAGIEYDKFTKAFDVSIPYYKNGLLRGTVFERGSGKDFSQLYVDLVFYDKWGSIDRAFDENGQVYDVTKISSDVDCGSGGVALCKLTETLGVELSEAFLRDNQDGFSMKFTGRKSRVVNIYPAQVQGFLEGFDRAKELRGGL